MKLLRPHELDLEGVNHLTYFSSADDMPKPRPFDYAHYHKYEHGRAREHGLALISAYIPRPDQEDIPSLTAIVPLGKWNRLGRYKSLFEDTDSELLTAFFALKQEVSAWTGRRFQVQEPCPKNVTVSVSSIWHGLFFGYIKQEIDITRRGKGVVVDSRVTRAGGVFDFLSFADEQAHKMERIADNVANLLDVVLATEVVKDS